MSVRMYFFLLYVILLDVVSLDSIALCHGAFFIIVHERDSFPRTLPIGCPVKFLDFVTSIGKKLCLNVVLIGIPLVTS